MTLFKRFSETAESTSADRNFEHCEKEFALCYRLVYRMNLVEGLRLKLLHTISSFSYSGSETHVGRNTSMPMKRSNKSSARKINVILKTMMWVSAEKKRFLMVIRSWSPSSYLEFSSLLRKETQGYLILIFVCNVVFRLFLICSVKYFKRDQFCLQSNNYFRITKKIVG